MKLVFYLLGVLAGAALLAGCGAGKGAGAEDGRAARAESARSETSSDPRCPTRSEQLRVALDGHAGPENAGILVAERRGFFRDAGLRVRVERPTDPRYLIPHVAAGRDDFGVAQQPQIVIARDEGAPLIAIGALVSQPTEAMIWLRKSRVDGLADLKGKTIAIPGLSFQRDLLRRALARAGLGLDDVNVEQVGYGLVPALLSGKADAIFGGSWNLEGAALKALGTQPVVTKARDLGIPAYEESMLTAPYECVYKHPGIARDFLAAVRRGTKTAVEDPRSALRAIKEDVDFDPGLGRREVEAQLKATLPLLSKREFIDPAVGQDLIVWMTKEGMVKQEWPFSVIFTDYYL